MAHRKLAIIRRRLFTILSFLSLLLCLATVGLWMRSYSRLAVIGYGYGFDTKHSWDIRCRAGEVQFVASLEGAGGFRYIFAPGFSWDSHPIDSSPDIWEVARIPTWIHKGSSHRVLGFGFVTMNWDTGSAIRGISVPAWFLALVFAILPALYLRGAISTRKRRRAGLCPVCGYDLRATPERCPECGTNATAESQRR